MKTKQQTIVETIKKIESVALHLQMLLKADMYSVEPMILEIQKHQEILLRIYEGRRND